MARRSNDEADMEREKAFRRGYVCGIQAMMSAVIDKLSKTERQDFETWSANELKPWSQRTGTSYPPEPPRWR
jgi:NAD(P)H-flavin reductase